MIDITYLLFHWVRWRRKIWSLLIWSHIPFRTFLTQWFIVQLIDCKDCAIARRKLFYLSCWITSIHARVCKNRSPKTATSQHTWRSICMVIPVSLIKLPVNNSWRPYNEVPKAPNVECAFIATNDTDILNNIVRGENVYLVIFVGSDILIQIQILLPFEESINDT